MVLRLKIGRVELFNKQFYRLVKKGKVIRQIPYYEQGKLIFVDFGPEQALEKIFEQIKFLFDPTGQVVANRLAQGEPLLATKKSLWEKQRQFIPTSNLRDIIKKSEEIREQEIQMIQSYEQQERQDYYDWLRQIKCYCFEKYGRKKIV